MHFSFLFLALVALSLYSNVFAGPLSFEKKYSAVGKLFHVRAPADFDPFPTSDPHEDPEPAFGQPKGPDDPSSPGSSSSNQIGTSPFTPPASYGTFPQKGQQLKDAVGSANGPDNDNDYFTKIKEYGVQPDEEASPFDGNSKKTGKNLKIPFGDVGLQDNDEWTLRVILGNDLDLDPTSAIYHNKDQQAMVIADAFNDKLGTEFKPENLLPHSELTFQGWKAAPGGDITKLKYVVVAEITNSDTPKVIDDARASVAGSPPAGSEVTFTYGTQNDAEQQAFYALAGTQSGKFLFWMLADHHTELGGLNVVAAHTWSGLPDTDQPVLIWELS